METLSLSCNHCGAILDIPGETRFVTCTYCDTKLEIRRKGGAAFTRVKKAVERLEVRTERAEERAMKLEREVKLVRLEQEIDRLERAWERDRSELMNKNESGTLSAPTKGNAWVLGAGMVGLAALVWWMAPSVGLGIYLGLACVIGGVVIASWQAGKAERYEKALGAYSERHAALSAELREAREEAAP